MGDVHRCVRCGKDISDLHHLRKYCDRCEKMIQSQRFCVVCGKPCSRRNGVCKECFVSQKNICKSRTNNVIKKSKERFVKRVSF